MVDVINALYFKNIVLWFWVGGAATSFISMRWATHTGVFKDKLDDEETFGDNTHLRWHLLISLFWWIAVPLFAITLTVVIFDKMLKSAITKAKDEEV